MYRDVILDHYKHPHNFGRLSPHDATATLFNTTCGDTITIDITFDKKNKEKIADIRFDGHGCAISQASASMLTEKLKGMTKKQIMQLTGEDIFHMLHTTLTPSRVKCALLPLEVVQKIVKNTV